MDSPDVIGELLPDGRMRLRLRNPLSAAPSPPAITPTPIPGSAGTFTEFYITQTGSFYNSGSDATNSPRFSSTNGNWNATTFVFTPTDGSNPVSAGVQVGDFAAIFTDGTPATVFYARISSVVNAANGAITVLNTASAGTLTTTGVTGRTINVGGAWASPTMLIQPNLGRLRDASSNETRLNIKSGSSYAVSANITQATPTNPMTIEGYTTIPGDGGMATLDASTNAITILSTNTSNVRCAFYNLEFKTTATTNTRDLVSDAAGCIWVGCIFQGAQGAGLINSAPMVAVECEAFACNKSSSVTRGGFTNQASAIYDRCYSHNHANSIAHGFSIASSGTALINCIAESCGGSGIAFATFSGPILIRNCDLYNNTADGITFQSGAGSTYLAIIENCNFLKNTGRGINNPSTFGMGYMWNCGYGTGTMANGGADVLGLLNKLGAIEYGEDSTPWSAPTTGNFTIISGDALNQGRGVFTETGNSKTGTVGTPNIGAA